MSGPDSVFLKSSWELHGLYGVRSRPLSVRLGLLGSRGPGQVGSLDRPPAQTWLGTLRNTGVLRITSYNPKAQNSSKALCMAFGPKTIKHESLEP